VAGGGPFIIVMSKDPAFLFYYQDFIVGTSFMALDEIGAYIKILCYMADKGRLAEDQIRKICGSFDPANLLREKFNVDDGGYYYNKRLSFEVSKRKAYSKSRRNNRLGNKICKSYVQHMENENENENEDVNKDEKEGKESLRGKPKLEEVMAYFHEINHKSEADAFYDYFTSNGWKIGGRAPMKDWKAAARNWVRNSEKFGKKKGFRTLKDTKDFAREVMEELNS